MTETEPPRAPGSLRHLAEIIKRPIWSVPINVIGRPRCANTAVPLTSAELKGVQHMPVGTYKASVAACGLAEPSLSGGRRRMPVVS
jgi:hypothetical protein